MNSRFARNDKSTVSRRPNLWRRLAGMSAGAAALFGAVLGCASETRGPMSAQSPDRQSDAEYDLSREFFYKGQMRAALDHSLKAVELNDSNSKALYFASTIYLWFCSTPLGMKSPDCRLADAEKFARRAVNSDDRFRDARNLLGQVLILGNKPLEAVQVLEPLTRDPAYSENHLAWGNLGWAQVLAGSIDEGIVSLKNSVVEPRFCVGHYRLGIAFEKKGELAKAEASLTNALSVESADCQNLQDAWEARARVRQKLGKGSEAVTDYERCRDISVESQTGKDCVRNLNAKAKAPAAPVQGARESRVSPP